MKKYQMILLIALAFMTVVPNINAQWGPLQKNVYFATYAIDIYPDPDDANSRAKITANAFFNTLSSRMAASSYNSNGVTCWRYIKREDEAVTWDNWFNDDTHWCDFLFYYGHGYDGRISVHDDRWLGGTYLVDLNEKPLWLCTKWAFFNACTALNRDNRSVYMPRNAFQGLHAMFGFKSQTYEFKETYKPYKAFLKITTKSEDWTSDFSLYWVIGWSMWDAYKNAINARMYKEGRVVGVAPTTFYVWKTINGRYFEGHKEKFKDVYHYSVPSSTAGMGCSWVAYGNPIYYVL